MRSSWYKENPNPALIAAARAERVRSILSKRNKGFTGKPNQNLTKPKSQAGTATVVVSAKNDDFDYTVTQEPNVELKSLIELFDTVLSSDCPLHLSLAWPHVPPSMILPWMLREVCRGRVSPPLRTLFINVGRPSLRSLTEVQASTERLRARGVFRSGVEEDASAKIGADAHFLMFLGDTRNAAVKSVPLVSIVPHSIAMNDGIFWRDFDEKTLKGFKRYFDLGRLHSIRKYLDLLTSIACSPGFAFIMPPHFDQASRRKALACLPGTVDFVLIDLSTNAVRGRDASELLREILYELERRGDLFAKRVLILTDCPLRYSFLRRAAQNRREVGAIGNRVEVHRLKWSSRGRGWDPPVDIDSAPQSVGTFTNPKKPVASATNPKRKITQNQASLGIGCPRINRLSTTIKTTAPRARTSTFSSSVSWASP